MKHHVKRILSAVLVVLLCISLLSGLSFAATVNYKTGNPQGFQNVILNWGTRGTDATFLSPNALSFYEENEADYDELVQLSGSSNINQTPSSQLYKALQKLMVDNHDVITDYGQNRYLLPYTDCQGSNLNTLSCFYTGKTIGPEWDNGNTWNREHTWPNSKGFDGSDENDVMMLRPADSTTNSGRGNKAYGTGANCYDPNSASNGAYNLHGDVARIFLYIYVRWGNNAANRFGGTDTGVIESKELLLQWMKEDPVDTWEMGRNDSVESITGTRNIFVDYPELAFALFDEEIPTDMVTPSGKAIEGGNIYTITAQSNNSAWGNVSLSGKTINAIPAVGYRVAGYTLVSGDATVTRNGNAFSVAPASDCTIQINFEEHPQNTVTFLENGTQVCQEFVYDGESYPLPTHSTEVPEGYTFIGWITAELAETTAKPATVYTAGKTFTATQDITYYALYSRLDSQGTGNSTSYELFTGTLVPGSYIITDDNGAMTAAVNNKRLDTTAVSPVNNAIDGPDASIIWDIAVTEDGYVTLYNKASASYAASTGTKSQAQLLKTVTEAAKWTPAGEETYNFINLGNASKGINAYLRRNPTYGFACYADSYMKPLTLYKQVGGTLYYSTSATVCEHIHTKPAEAVPPTCTEDGYTAGVVCEDCNAYISGHEEVPATGHSYQALVTPPTETEPGYTVYTCPGCGDTYHSGNQWRVSFVVPGGVEAIADQLCDSNGITLPTAGIPENDKGYRFLGWTTQQLADTETAPTVLTGKYTAKKNVTLYALYSYVSGGSEVSSWQLVTDVTDLVSGDSVVLASNQKGKVAGDINSQVLTQVDAVFSDDLFHLTQLPEDALVLKLGYTEGVWTLTNPSGSNLGVTGAKKLAWDKGTTAWTIAVDADHLATVASTDETYGSFRYNVNSPRFTVYTSTPTSSMLMPQLYKLSGELGTTYYTTGTPGASQPVTVSLSGRISTGDEGAATLALISDDDIITTVTATGTYSIDSLAAGTYTLRVSKQNHVTREYTVTVGDENVTQDVKIHLLGDLDGNGSVNMGDALTAYAHVRGSQKITDEYQLLAADVNGGGINMGDVLAIYAHIKGTQKLY